MIPLVSQQKLDNLAMQYGTRLLGDVQRVFEKYSRSGKLAGSPELTVTRATDTEAPKIIITYADQGFFIGQRNPQWTKIPDFDKMEEWSQDIQFSGPVPGYKNGVAPNLPPWKIKQRIAFAIARNKQKFDTHKPKPWKREAKLGALLTELNEQTLRDYSKDVEDILTAAIEGKTS